MPTNRLVFFLFFLVLLGSVLYLVYRPGGQSQGPVGLTPKEYMERVEAGRAARQAPGTEPSTDTTRPSGGQEEAAAVSGAKQGM